MQLYETIDEQSAEMMATDSKIGVLATLDDEGYPHLTFLSSIQGYGERALTWGKFANGLSKRFIEERPEAGFLVLDASKRFLSGNARYTHSVNTGDVFDAYNNKPLFRYNSYMGFSRVYFMDLVGISKMMPLPMPAIVTGAILSRVKALFLQTSEHAALPPVGKALFSELDSLKFLGFTDASGALSIVPVVQATAAGSDRIVFTRSAFRRELAAIPKGAKAAILCVNLRMESMLVKGVYSRGRLDIERVYNSMPPKMGYIYPRTARMEPVTDFE